ncbi:MAG: FAD-dependent monooxygenase [Candidatus Sulfotelmatobacter sp.]
MPNLKALIIGAGPTGMTAAIELRRAGLDVRIIDKATHLADRSQALVVQSRTLEQFQRYGIAQTVVGRGRPLRGSRLISEGREIAHLTLDMVPSRYPYTLFIPQSETEAILNEHMESLGAITERGIELQSLTQHSDGATAKLQHPDGQLEEVSARWILGCDGAHSTVRQLANIPFIGGGSNLSFFLGDLYLEGADIPKDELRIHLHRGDLVFLGPLTDKLTRVIVARQEDEGKDPSEDRPLTLEDFQRAADECGVKIRVLGSEWMTPFHVNDRQARHYRSGDIFLAGDASHIHSPVGGQGMNTGIQDVANLCWKLAATTRGAADPEKLLDSYEEEREAVGKALLSFTERGLKLTTAASPLLVKLRDALLPHLTTMSAVQKGFAGFISETAIEYRSSPIVQDHGGDGDLRAGDRMPDPDIKSENGGHTTLLGDWTDTRHLVIAMDATEQVKADLASALSHARVIALRAEDLDSEGGRLFGRQPKLLIVRPDGYIGFRGPLEQSNGWQAYARQDALL